jgi:RNA polymerase sigma factor (sigma-70 family)
MLEELTSRRYSRLLARGRMLAVSDAEAEDLVQEALIKTFSRRRNFESVAQAEQYVRRAIVTCSVDMATRGAKERERWLRVAGQPASAGDLATQVSGSLDAVSALSGLPPRVRACVALRYLEDLSIAQTARELGLSEGAVKRYVSDGLAVLNSRLGTNATVDVPELTAVQKPGGGKR